MVKHLFTSAIIVSVFRSRKSKKKDFGDGMLSMRARPPPEREFIDIFQKFKLSFNLLASLSFLNNLFNIEKLIDNFFGKCRRS